MTATEVFCEPVKRDWDHFVVSIEDELKSSASIGTPPGGVPILADDFNSSSIDTTKWSQSLFTGSQNTSVAVIDNGSQLQIGPLPTNASSSSYNGITSKNNYDITGTS